jgi:predicted XRE-type DNA-binding protein
MSDIKYEDPTDFLAAAKMKGTTLDLDEGRTAAEIDKRRIEQHFRHHIKTLIIRARAAADLSQVEVAEAWAVKQPQVSRFERDPGNAHAATLISYLAALGADIDINIRIGDHRDTIAIHDGEILTPNT